MKLLKSSFLMSKIVWLTEIWARFRFDFDRWNRITIPLPPIEIQNEIVNILDKFTELEMELETELEARKNQYEYYRDKLLIFGDDNNSRPLWEVCQFQNGFAFKSWLFQSGWKPILRITNIVDWRIDDDWLVYFSEWDYKENLSNYEVKQWDIVVAMSGATTWKIWYNYSDKTYYLNQRVWLFRPDENVLYKRYLFHWLLSKSKLLLDISSGSWAQPNLSSEKLKSLLIPIPSLAEQRRIANILDNFDKLVNDITEWLPAE